MKVEPNGSPHADHVVSCTTGHQVADGRGRRREYFEDRKEKLVQQKEEMQCAESEVKLLNEVRVYINGFLSDTTDIEMKRIVTLAGGRIMYVHFPSMGCCFTNSSASNRHSAAGATHILTSQQLSSSKTHKILTTKSRIKVHVVKPEWVTDSIKAGKRKPEREYSVIKYTNMMSLPDMYASGNSSNKMVE